MSYSIAISTNNHDSPLLDCNDCESIPVIAIDYIRKHCSLSPNVAYTVTLYDDNPYGVTWILYDSVDWQEIALSRIVDDDGHWRVVDSN